jgi:hypothetical protein
VADTGDDFCGMNPNEMRLGMKATILFLYKLHPRPGCQFPHIACPTASIKATRFAGWDSICVPSTKNV